MKQNLVPGMVLWIIALSVVLAYYFVDASRPSFDAIVRLRQRYGYLYSGIATGIFGGLIPWLYLWTSKQIPTGRARNWGLFYVLFWALRGIEVDAFYRLQDWLFGTGPHWRTILPKVLVDQFVYCVLFSAAFTTIAYAWRDVDFSWSRLRRQLNRHLFFEDVPSVLLSTWLVWIPATAIIYALPLPLQIPLFNLVLCFFVLLVSMLNKPATE